MDAVAVQAGVWEMAILACGSSFFCFSAAIMDVVQHGTDPVTVTADVATTAVCGSSFFCSSAETTASANTF